MMMRDVDETNCTATFFSITIVRRQVADVRYVASTDETIILRRIKKYLTTRISGR